VAVVASKVAAKKSPVKTAPAKKAVAQKALAEKAAAPQLAKPKVAAPAKADAVKPVSKPTKAISKPVAVKPAKPVKVAKPAKPVKEVKAVKPPVKVASKVAAKVVKVAKVVDKAPKLPKAKLVRDSFTMPAAEFALIAQLKARAMGFQRDTRKSELLRAGLQALASLSDAQLKQALVALPPLKAGRPKNSD